MSRCFAAGLDIHDSSAPPPPHSITTNILAPDDVPSYNYISSPGREKPRSAGTLESVVNQSIISHRRRLHKSTGDGGNHHQPAAVITTDALVPACNYNNSIHTYNNNNINNQHVSEFIPDEPYSGAAAAAGTKHGGAGVCSCKNNATRGGDRRQGDAAGKIRGEYGKSIIPTNKSRAAANALHNLSEKKRRDKINQRLKILQKLVPNCSKTDKASVLDDAIEYLKLLQAQVQMMMNMPPFMMLPPTMQQHLPWEVRQHSSSVMPDFISAFLASQSQPMTMDAYRRMATFYQQLQQSPNNAGSNN